MVLLTHIEIILAYNKLMILIKISLLCTNVQYIMVIKIIVKKFFPIFRYKKNQRIYQRQLQLLVKGKQLSNKFETKKKNVKLVLPLVLMRETVAEKEKMALVIVTLMTAKKDPHLEQETRSITLMTDYLYDLSFLNDLLFFQYQFVSYTFYFNYLCFKNLVFFLFLFCLQIFKLLVIFD